MNIILIKKSTLQSGKEIQKLNSTTNDLQDGLFLVQIKSRQSSQTLKVFKN